MSTSTVTVTLGPIDWDLLREQEAMLSELALDDEATPAQRDAAEGLLGLFDDLHEQLEASGQAPPPPPAMEEESSHG